MARPNQLQRGSLSVSRTSVAVGLVQVGSGFADVTVGLIGSGFADVTVGLIGSGFADVTVGLIGSAT